MKSMNASEVDQLVLHLQNFLGYELTNIIFNEKALQLSFSQGGNFIWLNISLKPGVPFAWAGGRDTTLVKGLKKPLVLFASTHFKGKDLLSVSRRVDKGRVLRLDFTGEDDAYIEIGLFTGGQNAKLFCGTKKISALKPKDLPPLKESSEEVRETRDPVEFQEEWQKLHGNVHKNGKRSGHRKDNKDESPEDKIKGLAKEIKKKSLGLRKMEEKLLKNQQTPWADTGAWLKENPEMSEIPAEFVDCIDQSQPFSWNLENCFVQVKKIRKKEQGTLDRIEEVKAEILTLESGKSLKTQNTKSLLQVAEAKGQTSILSNGWRLFVGKSAKDNLALLRRAKAWYLWMHIRDFPGAYGIIERPRKAAEPSIEILEAAAVQVAKRSVKGDKSGVFEVLFAECRYVRPIPKAKTGQVTYSHEKVVRIRL